MNSVRTIPRLLWFSWFICGGLLTLALIYLPSKLILMGWQENIIIGGIIATSVGLVVWASLRYFDLVKNNQILISQLDLVEKQLLENNQQKEAIFQISQKFLDASDESEVIDLVLKLSLDLVGATGASYVPLDEHGRPMTATNKGNLPFPIAKDWVEYLASPAIRDRCKSCQSRSELINSCPLLKGPFTEGIGMFCLPLSRGIREFGVLNLYLPSVNQIDPQKQIFLKIMVDETSLALEGLRLRQRELDVLYQMQSVRQRSDLDEMLQGLLENSRNTLESDFAFLEIENSGSKLPGLQIVAGELLEKAKPIILGLVQGVISSGKPIILGDVTVEPGSKQEIKAILVVPCFSEHHVPIGALLTRKYSIKTLQFPANGFTSNDCHSN